MTEAIEQNQMNRYVEQGLERSHVEELLSPRNWRALPSAQVAGFTNNEAHHISSFRSFCGSYLQPPISPFPF